MTEFYIGQTFNIEEYDNAYEWVQEQKNEYYVIQEIEPIEDVRMFVLADITPTPEEIEQKERERINGLKCTKRVFALMLQELGIDYWTMLKPLIESNPQAQLEWDLCGDLERNNPLLDIMAGQLGVTSEQLDGLFRYANGEITIEEFQGLRVENEEEGNAEEIVLPDETEVGETA